MRNACPSVVSSPLYSFSDGVNSQPADLYRRNVEMW
jgi:hypothetical protein